MKTPPQRKLFLTPAAKAAALAGGALAAAQSADAAIVAAVNTPISPPGAPGNNDWDVDGDGTNDFRLRNFYGAGVLLSELGDGRFVIPESLASNGFARLNAGFVVGPSLATGFMFSASAQEFVSMTGGGGLAYDAYLNGWALNQTGYFGFKFTNVSGTHYGWGRANISGVPQGSGFAILDAYYDDTVDAPMTVGAAIPEPAHVGLLALGAAGLAAWRRRRVHNRTQV